MFNKRGASTTPQRSSRTARQSGPASTSPTPTLHQRSSARVVKSRGELPPRNTPSPVDAAGEKMASSTSSLVSLALRPLNGIVFTGHRPAWANMRNVPGRAASAYGFLARRPSLACQFGRGGRPLRGRLPRGLRGPHGLFGHVVELFDRNRRKGLRTDGSARSGRQRNPGGGFLIR